MDKTVDIYLFFTELGCPQLLGDKLYSAIGGCQPGNIL